MTSGSSVRHVSIIITGIHLLFLLAGQVSAAVDATSAPQSGEADAVYKNGFVYTADGPRSRAQALARTPGWSISRARW
jgi:hypothetical protein